MIYYDWSPAEERFQVVAWRLLKDDRQLPRWNAGRAAYVATWHDGEVARRVISPICRESWTQYDPELVEREYLAKEHRRGLTPPRGPRMSDERNPDG